MTVHAMRCSPRNAAACLVACAFSSAARADDDSLRLTTVAAARAVPVSGEAERGYPVFELISGRVVRQRLWGMDDVGLFASGYARWDAAGLAPGRKGAGGDVDVLYAQARLLDRRLQARLGRQLVTWGASRVLHLDGAQLEGCAGPARFGAFAGIPVRRAFSAAGGDIGAGGVVGVRLPKLTAANLSFAAVLDHGQVAREELAFDVGSFPTEQFAVTAAAVASVPDQRLAEANLALSYQAMPELRVQLDVRQTAPDLFIPRNSIFSVFAEEQHWAGGGSLSLEPARHLDVHVAYHLMSYLVGAGLAHRLEAAVRWRRDRFSVAGIEGRTVLGVLGYQHLRLYAAQRLAGFDLSLNASLFRFDEERYGNTLTYAAGATAARELGKGFAFGVAGEVGATRMASIDAWLLCKLLYRFGQEEGP